MIEQLAKLLERYFKVDKDRARRMLHRLVVGGAAVMFVVINTLVIAFDDIFAGFNNIADLRVGSIAPQNIVAPDAPPFVSGILTEQAREAASENVQPVFDPPDPNVARQQTQLAEQIIAFVENIRRDPYATPEQRMGDINQITALELSETDIQLLLRMNDETWQAVQTEIINVLPRVMRESIRPAQLQTLRDQLPTQISIRFNPQERDFIVSFIDDLIRPNTFENPQATQETQQAAVNAVTDVQRTFERGQIIVREGERVDELAFEALQALGLLRSDDSRLQYIARALLASLLALVVMGLYMVRFESHIIYRQPRLLTLLASLTLLLLIATRFLGLNGNIYLFPTVTLSLLYVALASPRFAIVSTVGFAFMVGLMANNSLEITVLIAAGGIIGALSLRSAERLNAFFVAGALIALANAAVVTIFSLSAPTAIADVNFVESLLLSILSGILLVPAAAIAVMYAVTMAFNLPTALKLLDLSQPSKPLLQRLLREAPGSYQHSLQVANLAEQAASKIGANAQLTHVAALYHDIGKMINPVYFTENQQDIANPHDTLNDPYRSADIIIGHVTDGDEMAKQYRLPNRIREFIREHHGTTQVYVFYRRAVEAAGGDESGVDISDFTYPGPRPQSKETAILMLADSCEAAVRSIKPKSRDEINELVTKIFDDKRKHGQLDESTLTLNELHAIKESFLDILQGMFHPRINYQEAVAKSRPAAAPNKQTGNMPRAKSETASADKKRLTRTDEMARPNNAPSKPEAAPTAGRTHYVTQETSSVPIATDDEDDAPLAEVPRLPRPDKPNNNAASTNGKPEADPVSDEKANDS